MSIEQKDPGVQTQAAANQRRYRTLAVVKQEAITRVEKPLEDSVFVWPHRARRLTLLRLPGIFWACRNYCTTLHLRLVAFWSLAFSWPLWLSCPISIAIPAVPMPTARSRLSRLRCF
jgi:hypothetical protein